MSELQLYYTIEEKNTESGFRENLIPTYCFPSFSEYPVKISQLPDAAGLRY